MTPRTDIEKLRGDVHHLLQPTIGWLRIVEQVPARFDPNRLPHTIDRLYLALALLDEAATGTPASDEQRARHGVGDNHYPSLAAGFGSGASR